MENENQKILVSGETGEAMIPFSSNDVIITDRSVYKIDLLCAVKSVDELKEGVAYIEGDLYYLYKGEYNAKYDKAPGIYKDGRNIKIIHSSTEEERKEMEYSDKLVAGDIMSMAAIIDGGLDNIEYESYDCGRIFAPPIEVGDDILKRAIKTALMLKRVDIDNRRDRFADKNALFNAKQVIKSSQNLSAMLFRRWCEALNLDYDIILKEPTTGKPVGTPLEEPIKCSSTDTF